MIQFLSAKYVTYRTIYDNVRGKKLSQMDILCEIIISQCSDIHERDSPLFVFTIPRQIQYCYVHTQFYLALYMCVFILNGFLCGYF